MTASCFSNVFMSVTMLFLAVNDFAFRDGLWQLNVANRFGFDVDTTQANDA